MWLTARLRVLVAFVVAVPVGWVYMVWGLQTGRNIFRVYTGGHSLCSDSYWHDLGNNCGRSFSVGLAWFELVLAGLIVLGIGWLLARWALFPVGAMAGTVAKLGPTSLDVRLRATGPRDEARQLSDAIDQLLDRVAVGYEAQRRFAANASHELRTPLATQRTLIEVSLADALTPEQLQLLSRQLLATNERN
ncbi:MAG TPA: histidine kinase dimerization/phospho-acceptor domain-containing protein, partial [Actinomycetes bacterium]|nr:histidine kinase dimerization/phospho-acceptor domain-containing protein [Actinomycetes bacterium]